MTTTDHNVVEGVVEEEEALVPAVREKAVNLFGDASPVAVVERATEIATALAQVVEQKELFKQIGRRKHVYVEAWTLLGSMLGVFPIVEWTRSTEDGWEARVSARTMTGVEVGAAEAMCSRRESTWKNRDDYALRSMAQTRAVSKAMRHPLGFVMTLAGYDPTPEAEMPDHEGDDPYGSPVEFDPARDLLPGAISGENAQQRITQALAAVSETVDWPTVIARAVQQTYTEASWRDLDDTRKREFWHRMSNTVEKMGDPGKIPPISDEDIAAAFAFGFDGAVVGITHLPPPAPPESGIVTETEEE